MSDNATVSSVSNSAFVDGPLEKIGNDVFSFPVGKLGSYRPISISAPSSTAARFRGEWFDIDPGNYWADYLKDPTLDHISNCEYWILDRIALTNNVFVTLSYDTYKLGCSGVLDPANLRVARWNGAMWKDHGNGGNTGGASVGTVSTSAVVTAFSPFTLATITTSNPLPVTWLDFTAVQLGQDVKLDWLTGTEYNSDIFEIERSENGIDFIKIGNSDAAGFSTKITSYDFIDNAPNRGINYYRIKQIDFDGAFTYSEIRLVNLDIDVIYLYPNPSNGLINIAGTKEAKTIFVYNSMGQLIKSFDLSDTENRLDLTNLSQGVYNVRYESQSTSKVIPIVIR